MAVKGVEVLLTHEQLALAIEALHIRASIEEWDRPERVREHRRLAHYFAVHEDLPEEWYE